MIARRPRGYGGLMIKRDSALFKDDSEDQDAAGEDVNEATPAEEEVDPVEDEVDPEDQEQPLQRTEDEEDEEDVNQNETNEASQLENEQQVGGEDDADGGEKNGASDKEEDEQQEQEHVCPQETGAEEQDERIIGEQEQQADVDGENKRKSEDVDKHDKNERDLERPRDAYSKGTSIVNKYSRNTSNNSHRSQEEFDLQFDEDHRRQRKNVRSYLFSRPRGGDDGPRGDRDRSRDFNKKYDYKSQRTSLVPRASRSRQRRSSNDDEITTLEEFDVIKHKTVTLISARAAKSRRRGLLVAAAAQNGTTTSTSTWDKNRDNRGRGRKSDQNRERQLHTNKSRSPSSDGGRTGTNTTTRARPGAAVIKKRPSRENTSKNVLGERGHVDGRDIKENQNATISRKTSADRHRDHSKDSNRGTTSVTNIWHRGDRRVKDRDHRAADTSVEKKPEMKPRILPRLVKKATPPQQVVSAASVMSSSAGDDHDNHGDAKEDDADEDDAADKDKDNVEEELQDNHVEADMKADHDNQEDELQADDEEGNINNKVVENSEEHEQDADGRDQQDQIEERSIDLQAQAGGADRGGQENVDHEEDQQDTDHHDKMREDVAAKRNRSTIKEDNEKRDKKRRRKDDNTTGGERHDDESEDHEDLNLKEEKKTELQSLKDENERLRADARRDRQTLTLLRVQKEQAQAEARRHTEKLKVLQSEKEAAEQRLEETLRFLIEFQVATFGDKTVRAKLEEITIGDEQAQQLDTSSTHLLDGESGAVGASKQEVEDLVGENCSVVAGNLEDEHDGEADEEWEDIKVTAAPALSSIVASAEIDKIRRDKNNEDEDIKGSYAASTSTKLYNKKSHRGCARAGGA
ncbi:unnamed protein product [Amoebophrya sp. A25]|nr:unnamed protein product [Amoebophrya sp. A25]|eukprot:GSA25T00008343001.1